MVGFFVGGFTVVVVHFRIRNTDSCDTVMACLHFSQLNRWCRESVHILSLTLCIKSMFTQYRATYTIILHDPVADRAFSCKMDEARVARSLNGLGEQVFVVLDPLLSWVMTSYVEPFPSTWARWAWCPSTYGNSCVGVRIRTTLWWDTCCGVCSLYCTRQSLSLLWLRGIPSSPKTGALGSWRRSKQYSNTLRYRRTKVGGSIATCIRIRTYVHPNTRQINYCYVTSPTWTEPIW